MKAGSIVAVFNAVLISIAFMGANAQKWTETVIVPVKETSTVTVTHFATSQEGIALKSERATGPTCVVITNACIYIGSVPMPVIPRTTCRILWTVYIWQACPSLANVCGYSPCPGLKYCDLA
jgi:hypothetical protein